MSRANQITAFALSILALWTPTSAQYYYGKNKIQTQAYDVRVLETDHFQIHYYTGGEVLADFAAREAEAFYRQLNSELDYKPAERIPIIVYNAPNQFAETNVITDIIEEGVGGFTETFKNRVVVPFDGSFARFRKVLAHEITHVAEFDIFYRPRLANLLSLAPEFRIPLWVAEGFSEFMSGRAEIENLAFMRDLVVNNKLLPIAQLNDDYSYLSYRQGEAVFRHMADRYGRKKAFEFLRQLSKERNVEQAFVKTFGMSTRKFDAEFARSLRRRFWPQVIRDGNLQRIGRLLTDHTTDNSVYNTAPAVSPSGNMIAFISDRNGYTDIYVISALDGRVIKKLISGERSAGFESVHPYRGGISWAPDERSLALAAKASGRDCLTLVEFPSGRVIRRLFLPLDAIYSPQFAPDGQRIVLVGIKDCMSDIYLCDLRKTRFGELTRLTADIYEDRDPSFTPTGDTILFVSDRPDSLPWHPAHYAVFALVQGPGATDFARPSQEANFSRGSAIESRAREQSWYVVRLTPRADYVSHPVALPMAAMSPAPEAGPTDETSHLSTAQDSFASQSRVNADSTTREPGDLDTMLISQAPLLAFVCSDSTRDLCVFSLKSHRPILLSDFLGGVYYPTFSERGRRLTFAYYENLGWDIASIKDPLCKLPRATDTLLPTVSETTLCVRDEPDARLTRPYEFRLTPDYAVGLATYSGDAGLSGQLALALSDVLGNHRFYLEADLLRDLENSNFALSYWNLPGRTDFGLGFFQYFDLGVNWRDSTLYGRRNLGLAATVSYPFDKYTRLEFGPSAIAGQYQWYHYDRPARTYVYDSTGWRTNYLLDGALVFDNCYWGTLTAPERGTRTRLETYTTLFSYQRFLTAYVDLRNYLKFARAYVFANRLIALTSLGPDAERLYLGGELVRGYRYHEFADSLGTNLVVLKSELRTPFIERLKIAFPLAFDIMDLRGVIFSDVGLAWHNKRAPKLFDPANSRLQDLKLGIGSGLRLQISWFALKLDYGYPLSALSFESEGLERRRQGTWYFELGTDF